MISLSNPCCSSLAQDEDGLTAWDVAEGSGAKAQLENVLRAL